MAKTKLNEKGEIAFTNYKSVGKYLKEVTTKDFFISGTSSKLVTVVIIKDGKLSTMTQQMHFSKWFPYKPSDKHDNLNKFVEFINTAD